MSTRELIFTKNQGYILCIPFIPPPPLSFKIHFIFNGREGRKKPRENFWII